MKQERSKVKSDILLRVRLLYVLFILAGAIVLARLVWVQLFSAEVAYNADRLASRIFTEEVIPAQRGSILSRYCWPPSSGTSPPRPMPNVSARSTPAVTGWSIRATPPTCVPRGGFRA